MSIYPRKGHTHFSIKSQFRKADESDICLRCVTIILVLDWLATDFECFETESALFHQLGLIVSALAKFQKSLNTLVCFVCLGVLFVFLTLVLLSFFFLTLFFQSLASSALCLMKVHKASRNSSHFCLGSGFGCNCLDLGENSDILRQISSSSSALTPTFIGMLLAFREDLICLRGLPLLFPDFPQSSVQCSQVLDECLRGVLTGRRSCTLWLGFLLGNIKAKKLYQHFIASK